MKTFILVVIFHINNGNTISFQEFNTIKQCEYVRGLIYLEKAKRTPFYLETAFCVEK